MRFTFWVPSKKTKARIKFFLILIAIAAGMLAALESRFAILRVRDIKVDAANILPHSAVWGTIPPGQENFWPSFWTHEKEYTSLIEDYYPVNVDFSCCGWGKFKLGIKPAEPVLKVFWGGKYWYAAADGRIWLTTLKENEYINSSQTMTRPVLTWGSDRMTPVNFSKVHGNIFVSSLPMTHIKQWYDNMRALGWSAKIKYVQAGVNEGQPVVRLIFSDGKDGTAANILFPDDPSVWLEAGIAINKLYPDLQKVSPNIFIDTTYKGKILVKNKVQ
jgi:hypothetical protein